MVKKDIEREIMKYLIKDLSKEQIVTYLANELSISRIGAWKALKRLESKKLIIINSIGKGKTSTLIININWDNNLIERVLSLYLAEDSLKYKRWLVNFQGLEKEVKFLILYGSILKSEKEANDIDILSVVFNKKNFINIDNLITKIQKTQLKKIHLIDFTEKELKEEMKKGNKAFLDGIKKGVVLFGHERFVKFMKEIK